MKVGGTGPKRAVRAAQLAGVGKSEYEVVRLFLRFGFFIGTAGRGGVTAIATVTPLTSFSASTSEMLFDRSCVAGGAVSALARLPLLSACISRCDSARLLVWRCRELAPEAGRARISAALRRSVGMISRELEREWTNSGTEVVEMEERCLRTMLAARESIKLSWELHLLMGEKLERGEAFGIPVAAKGKCWSEEASASASAPER